MIQDRKHRIVFGEKIANVVDSAKHAVMRDMAGETCKSERREFRSAHLMTIWTLDILTENTAFVTMFNVQDVADSTSGKALIRYFTSYIADSTR